MKIIQQNQLLICEEIVPTDCGNQLFLNLTLFQIFLFRLYSRKSVNNLPNYPQIISFQNFKPLVPLILQIFDLERHGETSLKVAFVKFAYVFMKFRKLESLYMENTLNRHKTEAATGGVLQLRKSVLRNLAKFTRKHLCQSLFFNKIADLNTFG